MKNKSMVLPLLAAMAISTSALAGDSEKIKFSAVLTDAQIVGNVVTHTTGEGTISFDEGMTSAHIRLEVNEGVSIKAAHIHCAPAGVNGGVVVPLFGNPDGIDVDGVLMEGDFTNANIVAADAASTCGMAVNNVASLYAAAKAGKLYFNVHSAVYPGIRGQMLDD